MHSRLSFALLSAALTLSATALAETVVVESPATRVTLLELYTSEGCNSCPPADRWLSELQDDPRLWREVVPVAFHVDYWDYIGWPDRFASRDYSERQRNYARSGYLRSVYTPGLVLGGEEWRSWFFNRSLNLKAGSAAGPLRVTVENNRFEAAFKPTAFPSKPVELHLAVLGFGLETAVKAGENRGKTLKHDFVVLGHTRVEMGREGDRLVAKSALPKPRFESPRRAVAAWVSIAGDPYPIQAAGGWIKSH